jgi:protein phosphatase
MTQEFTNELSPSGELFAKQSGTAPETNVAPETAPEAAPASESFAAGFSGSASFDAPLDPSTVAPPDSADDPEAPLRIAVSALSDVGCVRTNNEDSFGYDEALGIYVVCDGMGGMASGEVASAHAVSALVNTFADSASSGLPVSSRLLHAINMANRDVWENGQIPENKGMGTTAVAAALDGNKLIVGNVGDSRAYIVQDGQCVQLTVDHSYINELIRNGTIAIENAHNVDLQGMESVITRAVGVAADVQPDFYSVDLKPGTAALLATDGLTRYVLQDEISAILQASPFESAVANLIDVAKQRGGQDNVTCILLLAIAA